MEIRIFSSIHRTLFSFEAVRTIWDTPVLKTRDSFFCEECRSEPLDPIYVEIIKDLQDANLLPKDYKMLCCRCYLFHLLGIFGINYDIYDTEWYLVSDHDDDNKESMMVIELENLLTFEDRIIIRVHNYIKLLENNAPWLIWEQCAKAVDS